MSSQHLIPVGWPVLGRIASAIHGGRALGASNAGSASRRARQAAKIERAARTSQILKVNEQKSTSSRFERWASEYAADTDTVWLAAAGCGSGELDRFRATYYRLARTYLSIERPDRPSQSRVIMCSDIVDVSIKSSSRGHSTTVMDVVLVVLTSDGTAPGTARSNPELVTLHDIADPSGFLQRFGRPGPSTPDHGGSIVSIRKHA
jgi:hypothetical protein